jgi:intracellular sulfur oxidation DsrE/DsrF family protein
MHRRGWLIALALLFLLHAPAFADPKTHRLALQISDDGPEKMNVVLNVAANASRYYSERGEEVAIEVVAFNAGLHMLRADTSPVQERIAGFRKNMSNVSFKACQNTFETMEKREARAITLLPGTDMVPTGVTRLIELAEAGWVIVRP